jgi:hypothetical protein
MSEATLDPTLTVPRLLYRGPEDDTAETCTVVDTEAAKTALAAGWRVHRTTDPARDADRKAAADLHAARAKEDADVARKRGAEDAARAETRAKADADAAKKRAEDAAKKAKADAEAAAKKSAADAAAATQPAAKGKP